MTSEKVVDKDRVPSSGRWLVLTAIVGTAAIGAILYLSDRDVPVLAAFAVATALASLPLLASRHMRSFRILCLLASTTFAVFAVAGFSIGLCPLVSMAVLLALAPFTEVGTQT